MDNLVFDSTNDWWIFGRHSNGSGNWVQCVLALLLNSTGCTITSPEEHCHLLGVRMMQEILWVPPAMSEQRRINSSSCMDWSEKTGCIMSISFLTSLSLQIFWSMDNLVDDLPWDWLPLMLFWFYSTLICIPCSCFWLCQNCKIKPSPDLCSVNIFVPTAPHMIKWLRLSPKGESPYMAGWLTEITSLSSFLMFGWWLMMSYFISFNKWMITVNKLRASCYNEFWP